jgi:hypothetical protein
MAAGLLSEMRVRDLQNLQPVAKLCDYKPPTDETIALIIRVRIV